MICNSCSLATLACSQCRTYPRAGPLPLSPRPPLPSPPTLQQATTFGQLSKVGALDVWESLELLNTLREYETALLGDGQSEQGTTPDMPLLEHALQVGG